MNPKLIKFAVEMQYAEKAEKKSNEEINFNKKFFNFFKPAKVTVPIEKNN